MTGVEIIAEFRADGGNVSGSFHEPDILLLHHTEARTGKERVNPLSADRRAVIDGRHKQRNSVIAQRGAESAPRKIP